MASFPVDTACITLGIHCPSLIDYSVYYGSQYLCCGLRVNRFRSPQLDFASGRVRWKIPASYLWSNKYGADVFQLLTRDSVFTGFIETLTLLN